MNTIAIIPVAGMPQVKPSDNLPDLLVQAIDRSAGGLHNGDVLVVCQKVVSKAEGRTVDLNTIEPSTFAMHLSRETGKDPRLMEIILRETRRIVRMDQGHLIVETGPGWVCANAGVDESNSLGPAIAILLPLNPDASAETIRQVLRKEKDVDVGVIISDTFGRPWREGLVEVAIGVAGIDPLMDLRGQKDLRGKELQHTVMAVADELAAAAGLVMEKHSGIPAVLIRGYRYTPGEGGASKLLRPREFDLFR